MIKQNARDFSLLILTMPVSKLRMKSRKSICYRQFLEDFNSRQAIFYSNSAIKRLLANVYATTTCLYYLLERDSICTIVFDKYESFKYAQYITSDIVLVGI